MSHKQPTDEQLREAWKRHAVDPGLVRAALARVPPSWTFLDARDDGAAFRRGALIVLVSVAAYEDGRVWLHISVSGNARPGKFYLPSWEELARVKNDFIGKDRHAYQVLPPEAEYVNIHPYVLHLWSTYDGERVLPDFTMGLGSI